MSLYKTSFFSALILAFNTHFAHAQTQYNGDIIQGRKVITELDVRDLEKGKVHELFFRAGGENNTGQFYYVPVSIIKGSKEGKRVLFSAGVHANEMNSYQTANLVKSQLSPESMSGTVTIVHQFNITGLIANIREYVPSGSVKVHENLNRQATTTSMKTSGQRYSNTLWNKLLKNNADYAVDMHTADPTTFPLFAYANLSIPEVVKMTELFGPDVSFNSHSTTTVSGGFNEIGVPAFTIEIGGREAYEPEYIDRAVDGAMNLLSYLEVVDQEIKLDVIPVVSNEWREVYAEHGGFVVPKVKLLDKVKKGDLMFVQYDAFGHIVGNYTSPDDGIVVQVLQAPMAEAGRQLGAIVFYNKDKSMDDNVGAGSITIEAKFKKE
jgi:predicted deacylase